MAITKGRLDLMVGTFQFISKLLEESLRNGCYHTEKTVSVYRFSFFARVSSADMI